MQAHRIRIALAGNPNSGKSTIFNAMTGGRQHVGNYPGVTVETKQGRATHGGVELEVVDLPGTHSLTALSVEEIVARDFILEQAPDVVVDIVDCSNLERNLYLAIQLIELGVPLVLAFNMSDIAGSRGFRIDVEHLSKLLGVRIVPTVGHKKKGLDELLGAVVEAGRDRNGAIASQRFPNYGHEIEPHINELADLLSDVCGIRDHRRWFAIKLLEGDRRTHRRLRQICGEGVDRVMSEAQRLRRHVRSICGDAPEIVLADRRYGYISGACTEAVRQTVETRHERSDKIDAVITNRWAGLPIFAALMYLVFQLTFAVGNPMVGWLDQGKGALAEQVRRLGDPDALLISLLADGIIEGVGAVLVFVPLIMLLYLAISVLEDSGYMARAAFVLDKLMHRIGLHGKSFIPMVIGFGCTIPAVMATRILESRRDRLTTMLVLPLMSCGARLPIYVLIIGAFFPKRSFRVLGLFEVTNQAMLLFGIYVLGIVLAVICAKVLRKTIFRGEAGSFVMELPPYRLPALKGLLVHMWERSGEYLKKAGTIILAVVIVLWALKTFPRMDQGRKEAFQVRLESVRARGDLTEDRIDREVQGILLERHREELTHSTIGRIGRAIAPVLRPCGFDWKISTALLGSLAAKEVFISQMGVIYAVEAQADGQSATLRSKLTGTYSPLQGICIMLFILISAPCVATVAVTVKESGSWRWAAMQWGYLTVLAWVITTGAYRIGTVLQLGTSVGG